MAIGVGTTDRIDHAATSRPFLLSARRAKAAMTDAAAGREGAWRLDAAPALALERDGLGARAPQTVGDVFRATVARRGSAPALRFRDARSGSWRALSWREYYANCALFAKALVALGVRAHEAVNVLGRNSPEWLFANTGAILAGAVPAGIYPSSGAAACVALSAHCGARVVALEAREHLDAYIAALDELPQLEALVIWGQDANETDAINCRVPVYTFAEFMRLGAAVEDAELENRLAAQRPEHCATLVYTSGATGAPKGVMLSHDNLTWTSFIVLEAVHGVTQRERGLSFLPLAHVAAQLLDVHLPMFVGCEVSFAPTDGSGTLVDALKAVRPTFFFGVPQVWELLMDALRDAGREASGLQRAVTRWARERGAHKTRRAQFGGDNGQSLGFKLADAVVLRRVKRALGLDACRYCFSGAAPMSRDCGAFFGALDVPVYELFGQSECCGPHAINLPGKWKLGTVGLPLPATRTRVARRASELEYAGRHVFMGYLHDERATRAALAPDGWLRSGDAGEFDDDGFLVLTGRLKELIVTAGGENVAPAAVETAVLRELPALAHAVVVGDRREFLVCLCVLRVRQDSDGVPSELLDRVALRELQAAGSDAQTVAEAQQCPHVRRYVAEGIARANADAHSHAQRVRRFLVLATGFSVAGGELTPTLKLRRAVVVDRFARELDALYAAPDEHDERASVADGWPRPSLSMA